MGPSALDSNISIKAESKSGMHRQIEKRSERGREGRRERRREGETERGREEEGYMNRHIV